MTEWNVVGVIIVLLGFLAAIVTPIVKLNNSLTRMTVVLEHLEHAHKADMKKNTATHRRMWDRLDGHDSRLSHLEHRKESSHD